MSQPKPAKNHTSFFSTLKKSLQRLSPLSTVASAIVTGIIFGLFVNTVTLMLQEEIAKQKYFEALEHEIMQNYTQSRALIDHLENSTSDTKPISTLLMRSRYRDDIWKSGNALGYMYSLDQELQSQIYIYYSFNVQIANKELDYIENSVNQLEYEFTVCSLTKPDCSAEKTAYDQGLIFFENQQQSGAQNIFNNSEMLMSKFHPSDDRIHSPFLRFFMGSEIVPILKRD